MSDATQRVLNFIVFEEGSVKFATDADIIMWKRRYKSLAYWYALGILWFSFSRHVYFG